ncbi:hypothetical protein DDB_G0268150 [Dictyostelium discoideum AX4]|uniref:Transmembrane protein n=1 Tax=Dictyostelium discoideum TaxID=44689 RepID=Q55FE7_DICDI|nr:hypothetical protein DDB_G0268150 [Dictyostelium discoideum AX4]EAL73528.1 hypothetical protein DDB_G0268150 [Dictyostelium discoideum AX4]|eukprot:XP_647586.1 hypothetical protein DDB_G0268150 [Dictyostelium discoideum AX4]
MKISLKWFPFYFFLYFFFFKPVYFSNGITQACSFVLSEQNSICQDTYSLEINLNPNNYNYNPYFITSDLSSFVTLQTSTTQLFFGLWSLNFGADTTTQVDNIYGNQQTHQIPPILKIK